MTSASLSKSVNAVQHVLGRIHDTADILIQSDDADAKEAAAQAITDLQNVQLNLTGILQKVWLLVRWYFHEIFQIKLRMI